MYQLSDPQTVRRLLADAGFQFQKKLGQNFLIDPSVCPRMAQAACDAQTGVLEIGPGIGVLTAALAQRAKKVVAVELDRRLQPVLEKTLNGLRNVDIVFGDAMRLDLRALLREKLADIDRLAVCANLPYYITSPLLMHLLESRLPLETITVMVQWEAAQRFCARVGTRQAGAVTAAIAYYAQAEILFGVPAHSFLPAPKVDSAVIRLRLRRQPPVCVENEALFFQIIRAGFGQRRKTLLNALSAGLCLDKPTLAAYFAQCGLPTAVRAEALDLAAFARLADCIVQYGPRPLSQCE